jgi:hypothetical protein
VTPQHAQNRLLVGNTVSRMRIEPFAYLLGSADPRLEIGQETGFPERPCRYVRVLTGPASGAALLILRISGIDLFHGSRQP